MLCGSSLSPAIRAIPADLEARNYDMKLAVALDLPSYPVKKVAFELLHFPAAQACHVHVITVRTTFVKMAFSLNVQQIKFIDQAVAFEQRQRPVHGNAIDVGIHLRRPAQYLGGVQVLLCRLDDFQDDLSLIHISEPTRRTP